LAFTVGIQNNRLWGWGSNTNGQLGDSTVISKSSPIQIGTLTNWSSISCGSNHTLSIKTDGTLWAWGFSSPSGGQIGDNTVIPRSSPVQIGTLTTWSSISAGNSENSAAIRTDGTLWTWGNNGDGQLGDRTLVNKSSPIQVGTLTGWSSVSFGFSFVLAIRDNGTLWSWGLNNAGNLGQNNTIIRSSPVQIGTLTNWSKISGGLSHSMAIKTDGTLWGWGLNSSGQLGDNTTTNRSSPVQIGTLTNWSDVFANTNSSTALKTDGTLWGWGLNTAGAVGDATNITRSSPVQIGSLTNWTNKVGSTSSSSHVMAIKSDGTLRGWGLDTSAQLGRGFIGSNISRSSPVQIGEDQWTSVYAGNTFTTAIRGDNTLWAWGVNTAGYLGDSSVLSRSAPTQIGTFSKWQSVSSGASHTIAIREE
jgi:alpha-tubulin suppressor-like RCC1 family protein